MIHVSFCVRSKHPNLFMRGHNVRNSRTPTILLLAEVLPTSGFHAPHRDFKGEPWLHCEVVSLRLSRLAQIAPLPAIGGSSIRSWDVEDITDPTTSKSRFTLVATNPNHPNPKNLNSAPNKKPYETVTFWSLTHFVILKLRDEWGHGKGFQDWQEGLTTEDGMRLIGHSRTACKFGGQGLPPLDAIEAKWYCMILQGYTGIPYTNMNIYLMPSQCHQTTLSQKEHFQWEASCPHGTKLLAKHSQLEVTAWCQSLSPNKRCGEGTQWPGKCYDHKKGHRNQQLGAFKYNYSHVRPAWAGTPPKFNMEPENHGFQRNLLFQGAIFRFHVKLLEATLLF